MENQQAFIHLDARLNPDVIESTSINTHGNTHEIITSDDTKKVALLINPDNNERYSKTIYSVIPSHEDHLDNFQNVIKVHTLNLNDRKQRFILLSTVLLIWCVPTLIISFDLYHNKDEQHSSIDLYSSNENQLHFSSLIIILIADCVLFLFEVMEFRHRIVSNVIGTLFIIGGVSHFIATILFAHRQCHHISYCFAGHLGSSSLAVLIPIILGIDVIMDLLQKKYVRTAILAFVLWLSTLFAVIALSEYGNEFGVGTMDSDLFRIIACGWWMICICTFMAMAEIFVTIYILHWHKFSFDRFYIKTLNLFIGFALIISVSCVLIERDGCFVASNATDTSTVFCYYRLTYVLVAVGCVLAYELQTLSV